jgi:hypothetical protein
MKKKKEYGPEGKWFHITKCFAHIVKNNSTVDVSLWAAW